MAGIRKSKPVPKRENRSGRTELDVSTGESGFKSIRRFFLSVSHQVDLLVLLVVLRAIKRSLIC